MPGYHKFVGAMHIEVVVFFLFLMVFADLPYRPDVRCHSRLVRFPFQWMQALMIWCSTGAVPDFKQLRQRYFKTWDREETTKNFVKIHSFIHSDKCRVEPSIFITSGNKTRSSPRLYDPDACIIVCTAWYRPTNVPGWRNTSFTIYYYNKCC